MNFRKAISLALAATSLIALVGCSNSAADDLIKEADKLAGVNDYACTLTIETEGTLDDLEAMMEKAGAGNILASLADSVGLDSGEVTVEVKNRNQESQILHITMESVSSDFIIDSDTAYLALDAILGDVAEGYGAKGKYIAMPLEDLEIGEDSIKEMACLNETFAESIRKAAQSKNPSITKENDSYILEDETTKLTVTPSDKGMTITQTATSEDASLSVSVAITYGSDLEVPGEEMLTDAETLFGELPAVD